MTRPLVVVVALALAGVAGAWVSSERPVVVAGCEGLYYEGDGTPQELVASDLPLEASAHTAMHQMTQAIKLTLKDRGFRAGGHTVGYVVCDDSGRARTWSAARCRANARAAARVARVVALVGTLDSGCARLELPALGRAGIVLVSPLNTASDLESSPRAPLVRLSASDDAQAAVAARFVRLQGASTVAVLSDGTRRGDAYRAAFTAAARRTGLRVVASGRAEAAYVGGLLSGSRSRAELAAARRRVPSGPLVLAAGLGPVAQLATEVGALAEGAYLVVAGLPVERLGDAGTRFVRHFETAIGTAPHPYAVYAAQAAELVLDAIAGSDGTRAMVARRVGAAKVTNGLVGSLSFDARGDPVPAPVTIFRVAGRREEIVRVVDSGVP